MNQEAFEKIMKSPEKWWDRLSKNSVQDLETGCRLWAGSLSRKGYPLTSVRLGKRVLCLRAHRVSWALFNRRNPGREDIDHMCMNRACINPEHGQSIDHSGHSRFLSNDRYREPEYPGDAAVGFPFVDAFEDVAEEIPF